MTSSLGVLAAAAFAFHALQGLFLDTPWLLPDELHASDAARDTARDGYPSLWALVTRPLWLAGTDAGYELAKVVGAAGVAAATVPAYRLARTSVSERASLLVAAGSVFAPVTVLASTAHPAAVAYPFAAAALLFVVTRRLARAAILGAVAVALWPSLAIAAVVVAVAEYVRAVGARALREWPAAAVVIVAAGAAFAPLLVSELLDER